MKTIKGPSAFLARFAGRGALLQYPVDTQFDNLAPTEVHGNSKAPEAWAVNQREPGEKASKNLRLKNVAALPGAQVRS